MKCCCLITVPLGNLSQTLGMSSWSYRLILVLVLQGIDDLLLCQSQGVKVLAASKLLASQQCFSQWWRMSQALEH